MGLIHLGTPMAWTRCPFSVFLLAISGNVPLLATCIADWWWPTMGAVSFEMTWLLAKITYLHTQSSAVKWFMLSLLQSHGIRYITTSQLILFFGVSLWKGSTKFGCLAWLTLRIHQRPHNSYLNAHHPSSPGARHHCQFRPVGSISAGTVGAKSGMAWHC